MPKWNWSLGAMKWQEQLAFSLAFVGWLEGRVFTGDFTRGLAVGLAIGAAVLMLSRRQAYYLGSCVGLALTARLISHEPLAGWSATFTHVVALFTLLAPVAVWFRERTHSHAAAQPSA